MCPACLATAAWITTSVVSTGGVTALAAKILRGKKTAARLRRGAKDRALPPDGLTQSSRLRTAVRHKENPQ